MEEVSALLTETTYAVSISVCSIPEVYARLKALGQEAKWQAVWSVYEPLFYTVLVTDNEVAHQAISLRDATPQRLPTIDALIAATAVVHGLTLVHRDPHLGAIPLSLLPQVQLPDRDS